MMVRLIDFLVLRVLQPNRLLVVAALVAAMGFVVGYMEVHDQAGRELALRQGPPDVVVLQDFQSMYDLGPADEVNVWAGVDPDLAIDLSVLEGEHSRHALLVPLFPVRDAADESAGAIGSEAPETASTQTVAIGAMLVPLAADAPRPDLASLVESRGVSPDFANVVRVNGQRSDLGAFEEEATKALQSLGIMLVDGHLAIRPFAGHRTEVLSAPSTFQAYKSLFNVALILASLAVVLSYWQGVIARRPTMGWEDEDFGFAAPLHPKLAPIPSQQELIEADLLDPSQPHWATVPARSACRGIVACFKRAASMVFGRFRNRQSHQGDEAL